MTLGEMMAAAQLELDEEREARRANAHACIVRIERSMLMRELSFDRESRKFGWLDLGEAGA